MPLTYEMLTEQPTLLHSAISYHSLMHFMGTATSITYAAAVEFMTMLPRGGMKVNSLLLFISSCLPFSASLSQHLDGT
jgi:hypothetical protein